METIKLFELTDEIETDEIERDEIERDVWYDRWCDICDMNSEYSDDNPYGTCQCS
jgi:hypothetical protein